MPATHYALNLRVFLGKAERHDAKEIRRFRAHIEPGYAATARGQALVARARA